MAEGVLGLEPASTVSLGNDELRRAHPDIHFHAWTEREVLELLLNLQRDFAFPFEIEMAAKNGAEVLVVLRKNPGLAAL